MTGTVCVERHGVRRVHPGAFAREPCPAVVNCQAPTRRSFVSRIAHTRPFGGQAPTRRSHGGIPGSRRSTNARGVGVCQKSERWRHRRCPGTPRAPAPPGRSRSGAQPCLVPATWTLGEIPADPGARASPPDPAVTHRADRQSVRTLPGRRSSAATSRLMLTWRAQGRDRVCLRRRGAATSSPGRRRRRGPDR